MDILSQKLLAAFQTDFWIFLTYRIKRAMCPGRETAGKPLIGLENTKALFLLHEGAQRLYFGTFLKPKA
jgi:hypothetical protein